MDNYQELIRKYSSAGKECVVAMGARPSGSVHFGNMATIGLAGLLSHKIGPHISNLNFTVCDIDLPDSEDWNIKSSGYVRYFKDIPGKGGEGSLLDVSMRNLEDFIRGLEKVLSIRADMRMLSDVQREDGYREGLKKLLSDGGINQFILKKVPVGHALVFPMCEKCHTSNPVTPKYEDGKIFTSCSNPDCDIEKYEVDILDTSRDLAVHFFIDPIRDKTVKPNANIHVFGGDYSAVHDHANGDSTDFLYTKVGKVIELMRRVSKDIPDFLVGPTFYARDGNKMSKSKDNGLRIERLKEYYGNGYVEKVVDFISYVADRGFKHIDYQVLEQKLFG